MKIQSVGINNFRSLKDVNTAGISLWKKKNQLLYRTATVKAEGAISEMLTQILEKVEAL